MGGWPFTSGETLVLVVGLAFLLGLLLFSGRIR